MIEINSQAKTASPWGDPVTAEIALYALKVEGKFVSYFRHGETYDFLSPLNKNVTVASLIKYLAAGDGRELRIHKKKKIIIYKPLIVKGLLGNPVFTIAKGSTKEKILAQMEAYGEIIDPMQDVWHWTAHEIEDLNV